ncbi:MAG TPA: hypothetical protein VFW28_06555 [Micropepsaceae bacterium]|nr:hypothetical protein [Micropepsaceae bacterium]
MTDQTNRAEKVPTDRLTAIFHRIKQHRIAQWTIGYVAVAYGIQHAVTLTSEAFKWPDAVLRVSMLLLILGVPFAMVFAWYHGERTTRRISAGETTLASLLLVLISLVFYAVVRPSNEIRTAAVPAVQEASVTTARTAAASPNGAISVAVLPFLNLSSDKEQEFFSDGMTEEITAALAKVPDLRVVARTSAFEFKGKNVEVQNIGQQLHATHLIEGSVRKAGNRLRITAQLIKADDGTHIWAEDYDRELTDVFAIQEDIARAITTSLHMTLGLKPGENLVSSRDIDPELYQEFLRIRAQARTGVSFTLRGEAVEGLEKLLARAPNFAEGLAYFSELTLTQSVAATYQNLWLQPAEESRRQMSLAYENAGKAARKAIRLDSTQVSAYRTLAEIETSRSNWAAAEDLYRKSSELDPNAADSGYGWFLLKTGRLREGLRALQEARALEPLIPALNDLLALAHLENGQPDVAIALIEGRPGIGAVGMRLLASVYASTGKFDKAADAILASRGVGRGRTPFLDDAARVMRTAPHKARDPKALPSLGGDLNFVYAYIGAEDRLLDFPERALEAGMFGDVRNLFIPAYAPARKTQRFKILVRKAGLVEYWRAKGWPPQCHPTTADDFECV